MAWADPTDPKRLMKPPPVSITIDEYWVHSLFEGGVSDKEVNRFILWLAEDESRAYRQIDLALKRVYNSYAKIRNESEESYEHCETT
mgnify:FL=1